MLLRERLHFEMMCLKNVYIHFIGSFTVCFDADLQIKSLKLQFPLLKTFTVFGIEVLTTVNMKRLNEWDSPKPASFITTTPDSSKNMINWV